jgi:RNA polymerase sigma-70 factor (ECF subfamily)
VSDHAAHIAEYSTFYRENVDRLIGFLVLQGWSHLDAADCVQETLLAALPPTWATLENPLAWCRKVAYRRACDLLRRSREEPVADLERVGAPLIHPSADLDALMHDDVFAGWVAKLRGDRQRQVMVWTFHDATPTEIADALGLNATTVRSTLRNARARLQSFHEEEGTDD